MSEVTGCEEKPAPHEIIQLLEERLKMHRDMAACLAQYRAELVVNGFTREEALQIVVARQRDILTPVQR